MKFEIYINIFTHIASRDLRLNFIFRTSIQKLYEQVFKNREEIDVIHALKTSIPEHFFLKIDDPLTFPDDMFKIWWQETYGFCNHKKCEHRNCIPTLCRYSYPLKRECRHLKYCSKNIEYVIRLPYRQLLHMVRTKSFLIEKEFLYFTYHDAATLMMCYWDYKVWLWQKQDKEKVLFPLLKQIDHTIEVFAPKVPQEKLKHRMAFFRNFAIAPTMEYMKQTHYCQDTDDLVFPYYQAALSCVKEIQHTTLKKLPFLTSHYQEEVAEYNPPTNDFNEHYMKILPPCIANILKRHISNQSHPKHEERIFLFRFFHSVHIPLEAAENVWKTIIHNANDTRGQKHQLLYLPKGFYEGFSKSTSQQFNFNGCQSVCSKYSACPLSDIEDIGQRKRKCAQQKLWTERLKQPQTKKCPWPKRNNQWSPVIAYNSLVEFYSSIQ